jgi:hypothetical protein
MTQMQMNWDVMFTWDLLELLTRMVYACPEGPCVSSPWLNGMIVANLLAETEGGSGGSSGVFAAVTSELSHAEQAACSALPQGRVTSVGGSIGGIGGQNGSLSVVINYNSGQVSGFATAGLQAGWNGIAQASVSTGFIYGGLGSNNSGYSGTFTTFSGSGATFGGYGSFGNRVQVFGPSLGASLTGATGTLSSTVTSSPLQFGEILGSLAVTPLDEALSFAKQAVCQ